MTRSPLICLMALLLTACASALEVRTDISDASAGTDSEETDISVASTNPASEELECMSGCLGESDASGDTCVERCF